MSYWSRRIRHRYPASAFPEPGSRVVKLVIVGSDLRGTVGGIPECSVARKRENRQPIGKRHRLELPHRNAKLCGKIQPRVLVCGNHKES